MTSSPGWWPKPRIGHLRHHDPRPFVIPAKYFLAHPPTPAPTITLVTPSYQQGAFLERTIASIVRQRYPALEYIVQDGGSTDGTLDILRKWSDDLSYWRSEPDAGQGDAINRAFAHTTGEIMGWLNADDLSLPGALSYVANYFKRHPRVDVVYGQRILIDENDRQIGRWVIPWHSSKVLRIADYIPQESLFWRRSAWNAIGAHVNVSLYFALDWELLLRFQESGARIVRLPRFLGAFRVHAHQKSASLEGLAAESEALRRCAVGRTLSSAAVSRRLAPYLLRHIVLHTASTLTDIGRSYSRRRSRDIRSVINPGEPED